MSTLSGIAEQSDQAMAFAAPSSARDLMWRRIHVVIGATLTMALGFGTLALTSVFIRPLEAEFAWTRAEVSFGYAAGTIGMAVGGYVWGRVTDRVDVRILMAIGGSGMALSVLSMTAGAYSLAVLPGQPRPRRVGVCCVVYSAVGGNQGMVRPPPGRCHRNRHRRRRAGTGGGAFPGQRLDRQPGLAPHVSHSGHRHALGARLDAAPHHPPCRRR